MGKKKSPEKLVIAAASAGAAVGAAYLALGNVIFNMTMSKKSIAKKLRQSRALITRSLRGEWSGLKPPIPQK